ncbi:putative chemoreceptor glutamine deamidase CheD [Methylocella tundrae]|uniref:Probable chemoreceptor glutamine deamidase CheD n=1 Tax=Methylocella tundrae TaxID=227605 RepID=A0A8B6M5Y9_METTU|nr:chemotaxis protein CheD [Methylocella tundrae]VTZ50443.1 putative chemoreceptor glutamine deamidase CheD [Methylocella tundrae]
MTISAGDRFGGQNESIEQRVHIIQGEYNVSDDPCVVLTTLLGSCVAACLRDPVAGVGGMNHFLLPGQEADEGVRRRDGETYGVHLMELLVNGLLRRGARRDRIEGKLFGGARTMDGLADVGARNASFAERFLKYEGIRLAGGSLRGDQGRRIQFWPVSGRARQVFLSASQTPRPQTIAAPKPANAGGVEFF